MRSLQEFLRRHISTQTNPRRSPGSSLLLCLCVVLLACSGCGGGSPQPQTLQTPLAPQDFTLNLSADSVTLSQGSTSAPIKVSIDAENGFTGAVQVTLSALPDGVVADPSDSFSIASSATVPVLFGATTVAAPGNYAVKVQSASGSLSHSAMLTLHVQTSVASTLPRTTYVRTDAIAALDDPPGEPRRHRIAYDPAGARLFVANSAMNRIEVFSATDRTRQTPIDVPGATSADLSPDGATLWVGTMTEQAVAIDTSTLQVKSRRAIPLPLTPPGTVFDRPEELLTLANGKILMRLHEQVSAASLLAFWDPTSNLLNDLTSAAPQLFHDGLGTMARTGDHTKVVVAASDSSGLLALFDSNGNIFTGPLVLGNGSIPFVAANADGSRFAAVLVSNGLPQLFLLDGSLNSVALPAAIEAQGLAFSLDGRFLYASQGASALPVISVFDAQTLQPIGQVADASIQGVHSEIEAADATQLLFGIANRGVSFVDAANPVVLPAIVPSFASAPAAQPSGGPRVGGTPVTLSGQNFESPANVSVGAQLASAVTVAGAAKMQATSPPGFASGSVNVAAYFPSGWLSIAPDGFSYGPQIVEVLPNAGAKEGGEIIQVYGYGFDGGTGQVTVSVGGAAASVQKVENVTSVGPSLGVDGTYPFSLERITLRTPPGNPGKADIVVTSPSGTTTASNLFQYLQSMQVYANAGLYKFLLYDHTRQLIYLSTTDHVDVFDLQKQMFRFLPNGLTLYCPSRASPGPCPDAELRGMTLTSDGSRLIVADFGSQNVYLLDPDKPGVVDTVFVGGATGSLNSGPARVAATSTQMVLVGLSDESESAVVCNSCLSQFSLATNKPVVEELIQPDVTSVTGAPLLQGNSAGDHVVLAFAAPSGGPLAVWDAASPNHFATSTAKEPAADVAIAADGTTFSTRANGIAELRGGDLTVASIPANAEIERIPNRVNVPGLALHPSGALVYQPFLSGPAPDESSTSGPDPTLRGGVDILDAHSGRLRVRLLLPEALAAKANDPNGLHGDFLAIDERGQRIFALTVSGLAVMELASVPLGVGTLSPASGPASGGTRVTIRGSGFQSGTKVTVGAKAATATFQDISTLSVLIPAVSKGVQRIVITNPDGETVALDAAFTAN